VNKLHDYHKKMHCFGMFAIVFMCYFIFGFNSERFFISYTCIFDQSSFFVLMQLWCYSFLLQNMSWFIVWKLVGISVVIAVGIALVIIVYATLFVVCVLFIRKYDASFARRF